MRATPRADRDGKSPFEIITGLRPQGPLSEVFSRLSPEKRTPSDYVNELCAYTKKIYEQISTQLEAEFDKRQAENERGSRTNKIPEAGDLVFLRRIPNLKYDEPEKKKGDQAFVSKRLQYYASPKVYRVKLKTTYGSYVLIDPDTKEEVEGGPYPPERLICLEDCPFEDPVNKDDPLWIHIRFNHKGSPQRWVLRRIVAESVTGMHRLVSQDGEHDEIVDLAQHSWYFVYAPNSDPEDEASFPKHHKSDSVEPDESTAAEEMEQDVWDDEDEEAED